MHFLITVFFLNKEKLKCYLMSISIALGYRMNFEKKKL